MKFEEIMNSLREGKHVINTDWNGLKLKDKTMYVKLQKPDENSKNTEPYFMFYSGLFHDGGWEFKKFPWVPSVLDLFSEGWEVREWQSEQDGSSS